MTIGDINGFYVQFGTMAEASPPCSFLAMGAAEWDQILVTYDGYTLNFACANPIRYVFQSQVEGNPLVSNSTVWQDFHAGTLGGSLYSYSDNWVWEMNESDLHLSGKTNGAVLMLPIPYLPGSRLIGIRFRVSADDTGNGIKFKIVSRAEDSALETNLTDEYAERTITTSAIDVFAYEEMSITLVEGRSYSVRVEAINNTGDPHVWSYGLKTDKRVY